MSSGLSFFGLERCWLIGLFFNLILAALKFILFLTPYRILFSRTLSTLPARFRRWFRGIIMRWWAAVSIVPIIVSIPVDLSSCGLSHVVTIDNFLGDFLCAFILWFLENLKTWLTLFIIILLNFLDVLLNDLFMVEISVSLLSHVFDLLIDELGLTLRLIKLFSKDGTNVIFARFLYWKSETLDLALDWGYRIWHDPSNWCLCDACLILLLFTLIKLHLIVNLMNVILEGCNCLWIREDVLVIFLTNLSSKIIDLSVDWDNVIWWIFPDLGNRDILDHSGLSPSIKLLMSDICSSSWLRPRRYKSWWLKAWK